MGISMGDVFAQGILGAVGGAAKGATVVALDQQKAETEKQKADYLEQLAEKRESAREVRDVQRKKDDEKTAADFYARTGPKSKDIESIDTTGDAAGEASKGIIGSRQESKREAADRRAEEAKKTGRSDLIKNTTADAEHAGAEERRDTERKDDKSERRLDREDRQDERRKERAADRSQRLESEDRADARDKRHIAEADKRDWKVDEKGNYRRPDGSLVTERVKIEGRGFEEVPVKAPKSKLDQRKEEIYSKEDEIKALDQEIRIALRAGDSEAADRLRAEKRAVLSGAPTTAQKPWEKFGKAK